MPQLPEVARFPAIPKGADPAGIVHWAQALAVTLTQLWRNMVYTYNALFRIDTLANRTTTPDLDESFFAASDTKQLFGGVSGAWENLGPRRARATVVEAATTVAVTLSPAENATTYILSLTPSYDAGRVWYTAKATSGFTINVATAAPVGGGTVDWTLWRA